MEHGSISDSLIFEIAKKKDIPVYIIAMNTGFNSDGLFSILKYNSKKLVDISHVTKNGVNYSDMLATLNSNYSSNNKNVSYNKNEYATYDPNKGNIYIGKMNGDANYYHQKHYNNFGSLTIIQHNVDNTKKNLHNLRYIRDLEYTRTTNKSQDRRNEYTVGAKTMRNSNSSSLIFMNSYGGSRPQKSDEMRETYNNKREPGIDREDKVWTVRKETYECNEVF